jgi:predicted membrane-bound dolichyl-phosphate-mannose-protein mannosyltransferase
MIRYFALAYLALHYGQETFRFLASHAIGVAAVAIGLAVVAIVILQIVERKQEPQSNLSS